jgi:hypothetical protein
MENLEMGVIITLLMITLLNYVCMYIVTYLTFVVLREYNVEMFFEEVLGQSLSDYYLSLSVKVIIPLYGTIFGLIFLYRYLEFIKTADNQIDIFWSFPFKNSIFRNEYCKDF